MTKEKLQELVIFKGKNEQVKLRGDFSNKTIWASLDQIADLFGRDKSVISRHLTNIFKEKELERNSVVAKKTQQPLLTVKFIRWNTIISMLLFTLDIELTLRPQRSFANHSQLFK